MIKYIGSKRLLMPWIVTTCRALRGSQSVVDLFSGTSRVGFACKQAGMQVRANDSARFAATIARCYVQADREHVATRAEALIEELNALPGEAGYFTETFCEKSRFFRPFNGERVDAIRNWIESAQLEPDLHAVLLTSLMEAADRVDSTTGVQMAYLKDWSYRSHRTLTLRLPELASRPQPGACEVHCLDAQAAATLLTGDVGYLDPPYNSHKYFAYYHVWETLVRWDRPEVYGKACKRVDCREHKSAFNSKVHMQGALRNVVRDLDVRHLVVSFNDEGHITKDAMLELLSARGDVFVLEVPHRRYVGAKIGIHDHKGQKVGRVSHLANTEYLFVVPEHADDFVLVREALRAQAPLEGSKAMEPAPTSELPAAAFAGPPTAPLAASTKNASAEESAEKSVGAPMYAPVDSPRGVSRDRSRDVLATASPDATIQSPTGRIAHPS